jgi:hypothetical protein
MAFDLGIRKPLAKPEGWQPAFKHDRLEKTHPLVARVDWSQITRQASEKTKKCQHMIRNNGHVRTGIQGTSCNAYRSLTRTTKYELIHTNDTAQGCCHTKDYSVRSITCRIFRCWKRTESSAFQLRGH